LDGLAEHSIEESQIAIMLVAREIHIRGIVQGVGFRPTVYKFATENHLSGWVNNSSKGVTILIQGTKENVTHFILQLKNNPPPLAHVDEFSILETKPQKIQGFQITESVPDKGDFIPISPDIATCPDCQRELFDPKNSRFHYPFINCTNCGPRFTVIKNIPYDRPFTTMASFKLCKDCQHEYEDPTDRRFHAQPIACPNCGPQVWLEMNGKYITRNEEAIIETRKRIMAGEIVAIKGLGGFLLACDARNTNVVGKLRERKRRIQKPFALMAWDEATIQKYCRVSSSESQMINSVQHPIVLLKRNDQRTLPFELAPNQHTLGFMLPYTPLHLLLMEPAPGYPDVLVMTSGNISDEPIAYDDEEARNRLSGIADSFLMNDRPIHMRIDDSVFRVVDKKQYPIRRARGYAPNPILLMHDIPQILATGAQLKNTFCLTRNRYAFVSHHIGDLENFETLQSFEQAIPHFERLFRISPEIITCDLHPDYLSSRYARERACKENLPLIEVQHHHAHLAACLVDNCWLSDEPVIGLCFDGTGYGTDANIWGGEVLLGSYKAFSRPFHLKYMPLPGGDVAIHKPSRMALAQLWQNGIEWANDLAPVEASSIEEMRVLKSQLEHKLNTPLTSSMGRLFDAAASIIGVCQIANYEGQAAIELEACADPNETGYYEIALLENGILDASRIFPEMVSDIRKDVSIPILSAKFHNSIMNLVSSVCHSLRESTGCSVVALSGGVWQNQFLLQKTLNNLKNQKYEVLWHHQVPCNDGGISLGQTVIASKSRR
jgi:hydrogenase maturation protein HypF